MDFWWYAGELFSVPFGVLIVSGVVTAVHEKEPELGYDDVTVDVLIKDVEINPAAADWVFDA